MAHCYERGLEMLVGDKTHIHIYEQGTAATVKSQKKTDSKKEKKY